MHARSTLNNPFENLPYESMEIESTPSAIGGGATSLPSSPPLPIAIPGASRHLYATPTTSSPMNIKTMISSSAPMYGPGGVNLLNDNSSPEEDDIYMTEYILPDPQPSPHYHQRSRAFSQESSPSTRIQARDYHNAMLIGSLPIRDPRTGTFAKDFRNPTLMRALGPIASQYHGEFIVGNQNLLRPIDIAAPAPPAAAAPPRSPEGDWSVTSSTSSAIIKVNAQGDRIYVCSHVGCDQEFQKSSDLRSHIYSAHPDVPSHICTYCLSRFTRKNDLLRHEKTVHSNGPKMDVCSGCGKGFSRPDSLRRHEKICLPQ